MLPTGHLTFMPYCHIENKIKIKNTHNIDELINPSRFHVNERNSISLYGGVFCLYI